MWYCPCYVKDLFAYNHIDDDDFHCAILEGISDCAFRLQEMNSKVFTPFEICGRLDTPFGDIDPDMQYYTDMNYVKNMKCDYYFEDAFNKKIISIETNKLSLFHQNIKAYQKHFDDFESYINSLDMNFSFIGLSEIWLDKDNKNSMISKDIIVLTGTEKIGRVVVFPLISEKAYLILEEMILSILIMNWDQFS